MTQCPKCLQEQGEVSKKTPDSDVNQFQCQYEFCGYQTEFKDGDPIPVPEEPE